MKIDQYFRLFSPFRDKPTFSSFPFPALSSYPVYSRWNLTLLLNLYWVGRASFNISIFSSNASHIHIAHIAYKQGFPIYTYLITNSHLFGFYVTNVLYSYIYLNMAFHIQIHIWIYYYWDSILFKPLWNRLNVEFPVNVTFNSVIPCLDL